MGIYSFFKGVFFQQHELSTNFQTRRALLAVPRTRPVPPATRPSAPTMTLSGLRTSSAREKRRRDRTILTRTRARTKSKINPIFLTKKKKTPFFPKKKKKKKKKKS